ncbi:unnamed protein product [Paramecium sonneborni]|uniref:Uncharacterized protein n=1 Tax=Paramecium sonneborni TaxID=65129 RepID=A0A8S1PVB2_9CILI|nr:unnamed protein product [Paramecium sonneborni]
MVYQNNYKQIENQNNQQEKELKREEFITEGYSKQIKLLKNNEMRHQKLVQIIQFWIQQIK